MFTAIHKTTVNLSSYTEIEMVAIALFSCAISSNSPAPWCHIIRLKLIRKSVGTNPLIRKSVVNPKVIGK